MKTTGIGSAHAETANEHATHDVINIPFVFSPTQAGSPIHDEDAPAAAPALSHRCRSCRPSLNSFSRLF
jgi:hypothetical protein